MHVAIVYSLPSKRMLGTKYSETDTDSAVIASKVALAIEACGMTCEVVAINEDQIDDVLKIKADVIFNLIEWCGQDIALAKRAFQNFEKLGIPFTGSSFELFELTGDKTKLKKELQRYDFPTPTGMNLETGEEEILTPLRYPVIVKPASEHCSTGLSYDAIANNDEELRKIAKRQIATFHQTALAEEFIQGRELLVYLVENQSGVQVLPIEEVIFSNHNQLAFQTYESKWEPSHPDYMTSEVVVAKLSEGDKQKVEETSKSIFLKLGFSGYARFDVRLKNGIPYMLETNANPSVYDGDGSLSDPTDEVIPGIRFCDYVNLIVKSAFKVFDQNHRKETVDN